MSKNVGDSLRENEMSNMVTHIRLQCDEAPCSTLYQVCLARFELWKNYGEFWKKCCELCVTEKTQSIWFKQL